jgi:hypothetical protein
MNNMQKILLFNALRLGEDALKKQRHADGLWRGRLSSSAVSTAVALPETAVLHKTVLRRGKDRWMPPSNGWRIIRTVTAAGGILRTARQSERDAAGARGAPQPQRIF